MASSLDESALAPLLAGEDDLIGFRFAFDEDYPMVEPGKVDSLQLVMGRYEHVQPWDFALT